MTISTFISQCYTLPSFSTHKTFIPTSDNVTTLRRPRTYTSKIKTSVAIATPQNPSSSENDDNKTNNQSTPPYSTTASPSPPPQPSSDPSLKWSVIDSCDLLTPSNPQTLIFFIGGFGAGSTPRTLYNSFLSSIAKDANAAILAYRLPAKPTKDHFELAKQATKAFQNARQQLSSSSSIPILTLGHSLGAKLLLLSNSNSDFYLDQKRPIANIFVSFNNADTKQAAPSVWPSVDPKETFDNVAQIRSVLERIGDNFERGSKANNIMNSVFGVFDAVVDTIGETGKEFSPGKDETFAIAATKYSVKNNLVVRFNKDELDDSDELIKILKTRFGKSGVIDRLLDGTHVTPNTPDFVNGFYSIGNELIDEEIRRVADGFSRDKNAAVAIIVAFIRLQQELAKSES